MRVIKILLVIILSSCNQSSDTEFHIKNHDKSSFVGHWSYDIADNTNFIINDSLGVFYFEEYDDVGTVHFKSSDSMFFSFKSDTVRFKIVYLTADSMVVETALGKESLYKK